MENYGTMEKNYGTMEKWYYTENYDFDLLWKKPWNYVQQIFIL